jgi:hypothetical protein
MRILCFALAGVGLYLAGGCGLIPPVNYDYSFDPKEVMQSLGDGSGSAQALPTVMCPATSCTTVQIPPNSGMVACENGVCTATAHVRAAIPVDLRNAKTPVPEDVVRFGIDRVTIAKVAYWVTQNSLNVATPPLDLYVGPEAAADEMSAGVTQLGSVASLPAKSKDCADPRDGNEPAAAGFTACDMPLTAAGQEALAGFIKNYKTAPFKLLVHGQIKAAGGTPTPSGAIDLFVRPTVRFAILK